MKSLTADKQLALSTAHERARVFASDLKEVMKKLNNAEERTGEDWKPHGLPSTCQEDLDQHQELAASIQSLKDPVTNMKSEADGLKAQSSAKDIEALSRLMDDLDERWEGLMVAVEDKKVKSLHSPFSNSFSLSLFRVS